MGSITIGEFVLLFCFFYLFVTNKTRRIYANKDIKRFTLFLLLSVLSCLFSCFIINYDFDGILKNIAIIVFLIPGTYVLFWLLNDKPERVKYYLVGVILSDLLVRFFFPQFSDLVVNQRGMTFDEQDEVLFYYTYSPYFILIITLLYEKFSTLTLFFLFIFGFVFLWGGSRANFLIYLMSATILIFTGLNHDITRIEQKIKKYKFTFLFFIVIAGFGISKTYSYLAETGMLGGAAQAKYEMQTVSKAGILGGRSSFFRGLIAVKHHPIIGVGSASNAKINDGQIILKEYQNFAGEYTIGSNIIKNISGHSTILDWWLSFGLLSLPFWIWIIMLCCKCLTKYFFLSKQLTAYMIVGTISLLWDIFFSPFGFRIRYEVMIALIIILKHQYENSGKAIISK
jgi:hypothetical protein